MSATLLTGRLVRLIPPDVETNVKLFVQWRQDSEFQRLEAGDPAHPLPEKTIQQWFTSESHEIFLNICTLKENKVIGFTNLDELDWANRNVWMSIGIGERAFWGKGYGTDALQVLMRYVFRELNFRRISLDVFEYNPRAIRCYEKAGFVHEGRARKAIHRDGRRWDLIYMGILRQEWEALNKI